HLGVGHVPAHFHRGDVDDAEARIAHLGANELGELPLQGVGNPVGAAEFSWHGWARLPEGVPRHPPSQLARNLLHVKDFDLVAGLDVIVILHTDAALGTAAHFGHVVLEAPQGFQHALVDHHVVAQHTDRLALVHGALGDDTAGDLAELGRAEHIANLGDTDDLLADFRGQHAGQGRLDVIEQVVDHAVIADIDPFLFRQLAGGGLGADV